MPFFYSFYTMDKIKKSTHFLLCFSLLIAILLGAGLGALIAGTVNTINTENYTEFTPALPTKLLDINGELITEFASDEKREMIAITSLPQHMIDALITREDQNFFQHRGFSLKAIFRAVVGKLTHRSLGGGSTLTQQIAGTLYCDRSDISVKRKIVELWWAIQMERRYSKQEILELYLNQVYLGGGTNGVDAASKYYFGHSAETITPAEAALLVIQLSNPSYYNPFEHPNRAQDRQKNVLAQMIELGYLSKEEADDSFEEFWSNFDYTRTSSSAYHLREDKAPWFSEYVLRELNTMMYGTMNVYRDGYTVNTTLHLDHQASADRVMEYYIQYANDNYNASHSGRINDATTTYIPMTELLSLVFNIPNMKTSEQRSESNIKKTYNQQLNPILDVMALVTGQENLKVHVNKVTARNKESNKTAAVEGTMISLENSTGYITSLVGGSTFDDDNQYIRATQATLQPGSGFKPLYYSAAIDSRQFTGATIIYDTPTVFYKNDGSLYIPVNFKNEYLGSMQLWSALANSQNIPSLKILDSIGFDAAIDRACALLGIPDNEREQRSFLPVYPVGLGVCTVQPIQMARAFAIFANAGKEVTPMAIRTVQDRNGNVILEPEREIREEQQAKGNDIQVITPQTAYVMTDLLQNTVKVGTLARGSKWGAQFRYKDKNGKTFTMPMGGKTGTTQNTTDAWAQGFSPYYTSVFWFGFDQKGPTLGNMTGATLSGLAWGEFMHDIHVGLPYKEFYKPAQGIIEVTVCTKSGLLPTDDCVAAGHTKQIAFLEGTEPTTVCEVHQERKNARYRGTALLQDERLASGIKGFNLNLGTLEVDLTSLQLEVALKKRGMTISEYDSESADDSTGTEDSMEQQNPLPLTNWWLD